MTDHLRIAKARRVGFRTGYFLGSGMMIAFAGAAYPTVPLAAVGVGVAVMLLGVGIALYG